MPSLRIREWSVATTGFTGDENGNVKQLHAIRVGPAPKFEPMPGTEFTLDVELVLLAMGFTGPVRNGMIDELVQSTTMSGLADFKALAASAVTLTPSRPESPATSPRSRPTFIGSMSMAPTLRSPRRCATCLATAAPTGPRPQCMTRTDDMS